MPRQRTADDKLLALLARMPAPLDTGEVAQALAWSRDNVLLVAGRLAREGRVERIEGERDGATGRPVVQWALPGMRLPPTEPRTVSIAPDTIVVTPSGEEARVVRSARSFAEIEYITGPERFQRTEIHVRLLRPFQAGRPRPEPVRVPRPAEKVAA